MKVCFRTKNVEFMKKVNAIPENLYFYPINIIDDVMLGVGIFSEYSFNNSIGILRNDLFYWVKFLYNTIFTFQSRVLTCFEKIELCPLRPFFIQGNSVCFAGSNELTNLRKKYEGDGWELFFLEEDPYFVDSYTSDLNPLLQLVSMSKKMKKRETDCFNLAINAGFPYRNIVDFMKKKINPEDHALLEEWECLISSQHGAVEEDFSRTLKRSIKKFVQEYYPFLQEIGSLIAENDENYSLQSPINSLRILIENERILGRIPRRPRLPLLKIRSLKITGIFHVFQENIDLFINKLQLLFSNNLDFVEIEKGSPHEIDVKEDKRKRIAINFLFDFTRDPISVDEILDRLELFRSLVIEVSLKEIDQESYKKFKNLPRKELWISETEFSLMVPQALKEEIKKLISSDFKYCLDYESGIKEKAGAEGDSVLIFKTCYAPYSEFEVSQDMDFFFPEHDILDEFTEIAVENILRGEFEIGREYLERGKWGIHGDILVERARKHSPKREELLIEASNSYRKAAITFDDIANSPKYMKNSNEYQLRFAEEVNRDWEISLDLVFAAIDLRREIENSIDLDEKLRREKLELLKLLEKYSEVRCRRNVIDFIENIQMFYSLVLQEAEKKFGNFTRYWLGYDF
jgi:hypothetical protein